MPLPDWEIGRVFGIPIRIHASWLLVFLFMTWSLATGYLPEALPGLSDERYWGMGAMAALLLFASVLLHELGHSYVARRYQIPIGRITLFLFGGVAQMGKEPPSPRAEFFIAVAGPLVSFFLGAACLALSAGSELALTAAGAKGFVVLGGLLGVVNVQLGLFNLIPGFPLDGGRVLRAGLWAWNSNFHRATSQASAIGLIFGVLLAGLGLVLFGGSIIGAVDQSWATHGGWLMFIGAFLFGAAWSTRRQVGLRLALDSTMVREVMIRSLAIVPPQTSIQGAVDEFFVPHGAAGFLVGDAEQIVGVVAVDDVQSIAQPLWPWRTVRDVMVPVREALFVPSDWSIKQAMDRMIQEESDCLVATEDGKPVGLMTRSAFARFLQLHKT